MLIFYIKEHILEIKVQQSFNSKSEWISLLIWPQMFLLTMFFKQISNNPQYKWKLSHQF
jgi:hypothetical protein